AFILPNDKRVGIKSALWRHEPSDLERPIPRYKVSSFVLDDADRPIIFSNRRFAEHVIVMLCQDVLGQPWEVPQHLKIRGSLINRGLARCVFEKYSFSQSLLQRLAGNRGPFCRRHQNLIQVLPIGMELGLEKLLADDQSVVKLIGQTL